MADQNPDYIIKASMETDDQAEFKAGEHLIDGEFQSDKYPWCKRGFVPLKDSDPMAQPLLKLYAEKRGRSHPEYPWCKQGFIPLNVSDPIAQPLLWLYAKRRRRLDIQFADDLQEALRLQGYDGPKKAS